MARVRFDKDQVLESATNAFWRMGYTATSMQTVFEKTGLKPGSVYLAFGNKEGLFKESLDFYTEKSLLKLESVLSQSASVDEAIRHILISFIEESCQADYCSCFLVKSQLELSDKEPEMQRYVSQRIRKVENLYIKYLLKNNTANDAQAKAASIMLHIFGIRVYGYHSHSKDQLIAALHLGLPWLSWPVEA